MSVSVIVVTYNRLSLLKECLNNLLFQKTNIDNIFVINNDSNDGTIRYLNNFNNDTVIPVNLKKNLGGAGGFSLGIKIAFEKSDSKYFWLMDDDTMPTETALYQLVIAAKKLHGRFGYLCSNVRWWKDKSPSYLNVPIVSRDWNDHLNYGLVKTVSASFVSLFVSRKSVSKLGLPISDMFIWGDDVEYTTRLSRMFNSYLVSESIVLHKSKHNSTNESVLNVSMNRLIYYKCMFRNRLYISRRYYRLRRTIKLFIVYIFVLISIPFYARDHRIKRFISTLEGVLKGLFFNPQIKFPKKK